MGRTNLRNELLRDPHVLHVSRRLRMHPALVCGGCFALWAYADEHARLMHGPGCGCPGTVTGASASVTLASRVTSRDTGVESEEPLVSCPSPVGRLQLITAEIVDEISGIAGFAAALAETDWLLIDERGVSIPRYGEHCGSPQKRRIADRLRQRRRRERLREERASGSVTPLSADRPHRSRRSHARVTRDTPVSHTDIRSSSASSSASASSLNSTPTTPLLNASASDSGSGLQEKPGSREEVAESIEPLEDVVTRVAGLPRRPPHRAESVDALLGEIRDVFDPAGHEAWYRQLLARLPDTVAFRRALSDVRALLAMPGNNIHNPGGLFTHKLQEYLAERGDSAAIAQAGYPAAQRAG